MDCIVGHPGPGTPVANCASRCPMQIYQRQLSIIAATKFSSHTGSQLDLLMSNFSGDQPWIIAVTIHTLDPVILIGLS